MQEQPIQREHLEKSLSTLSLFTRAFGTLWRDRSEGGSRPARGLEHNLMREELMGRLFQSVHSNPMGRE